LHTPLLHILLYLMWMVKFNKVVAAHDSGRIVNRKLFEGQIHGGVDYGDRLTL